MSLAVRDAELLAVTESSATFSFQVCDYPGGFAHYRLFEDGSFLQEVRRTSSERALAHSTRCRDFFRGGYRSFSLGPLPARSFVAR